MARVHEPSTDFGSGTSGTSQGSKPRVHELGSTRSGPRAQKISYLKLKPSTDFGSRCSLTRLETVYGTLTDKLFREHSSEIYSFGGHLPPSIHSQLPCCDGLHLSCLPPTTSSPTATRWRGGVLRLFCSGRMPLPIATFSSRVLFGRSHR